MKTVIDMNEMNETQTMEEKPILYFDMDGVLVDFQSGFNKMPDDVKKAYEDNPDEITGIFGEMEPMPGALDAVRRLAKRYDCYILSTAPWKNPSAWSDKVEWVTRYLDDVFHKKIILTHNKDFCRSVPGRNVAFIIDDRSKHGVEKFGDKHILFGSEQFPDWDTVVTYLESVKI